MKRIMMILAFALLVGCSSPPSVTISGKEDLAHLTIGVVEGAQAIPFLEKEYPSAKVLQFKSTVDVAMAVKARKVDCGVYDVVGFRPIVKKDASLALFPELLTKEEYAMAVKKGNDALRSKLDAFLTKIKADGTYTELYQRWTEDESVTMPEFPSTGESGTLVVGVASNLGLPICSVANGKVVGTNAELAYRFAQAYGYQLEVKDMDFAALIPALASGKVDFITCDITITEERAKNVDFTVPFDGGGLSILALKETIKE